MKIKKTHKVHKLEQERTAEKREFKETHHKH